MIEAIQDLYKRLSRMERRLDRIEPRIIFAPLHLGRQNEVTISGDAITVGKPHTLLTPEAGVTDDLATLNGGQDGKTVILRPADASYTITVKDATGNILTSTGADVVLTGKIQSATFTYIEADTTWYQI